MRIDTILESTLRNSKLKRVRVKIDPAQLVMQNYHMLDSYEGYVLEENLDTLKVYMLDLPDEFEPVQTVNKSHTEELPGGNNTNIIPRVLKQLEQEGVSCDNPAYQKIQNLHDAEFVDSYLRELGYDDKKLIEFYKKISLNPVYEGVADLISKGKNAIEGGILKGGQAARGLTSSGLFKAGEMGAKGLASIPGLLVGKNNIIGRFAKFLQTFDVNELIKASEKYDSKDPTKIKEGSQIFIKFSVGPSKVLPDTRLVRIEGEEYQLSGVVQELHITDTDKSFRISVVHPHAFNSQYSASLSYPEIFNKQRIGQIVLAPREPRKELEIYNAKIKVTPKYILVHVYERVDSHSAGNTSLNQDNIRLRVEQALKQFLGDRTLENITKVVGNIAGNLSKASEEDSNAIKRFEDDMIDLLQDKAAVKSGNPLVYIKEYLGRHGFYTEYKP